MPLTFPLIPDAGTPNYVIRVPLDARNYIMEFRWSARESCWYIDLYDDDENPIHYGQKIVVNFPLFARVVDERCPPGIITAMDTSSNDLGPGLGELGGRVILLYYTAEEVPEFLAAIS